MKAWLVYVEEPCVDRVEVIWDVVWAETRGKAKKASIFWSGPSEVYEWTEIKARRIPALDGKRENEVTTAEAIQVGLPITDVIGESPGIHSGDEADCMFSMHMV